MAFPKIVINAPHRRLNPLTGEFILVSPHRTQRPWLGQVEKLPVQRRPVHDPGCYLCPGCMRAGEVRNPEYTGTYVFTNDFSALVPEKSQFIGEQSPLFHVEIEQGECRVICFSPRHDLTLAEMEIPEISAVIDVWAGQISELGKQYRWVQVFENRGEMMGSSNPHPHGQVWAGTSLPNEPAKEDRNQKSYSAKRHSPLLVDYIELEVTAGERLVIDNPDWVVVVPFWALWPFETLLMPRRHILRLTDLTPSERESLADILKRLLTRYDNLFEVSFPYSMGWHGAPTDSEDNSHWQLHAHFYPPLLRSAVIKKFMVGYELLAEAQRDLTPEQAAERLRGLSEVHYAHQDIR